MGFVIKFSSINPILLFIASSFSFSVSRVFVTLFNFFCTYLLRVQGNVGSSENDFDRSEILSEEINGMTSEFFHSSSEFESESETESRDVTEEAITGFADSDIEMEEEKNEFSFRFKFPTFEEFSRSQKANDDLVHSELVSSSSISSSRYQFFPVKSFSGFVEEPDVPHFDVKQISTDSSCHNSIKEQNFANDQISYSDSVGVVELSLAPPPSECLIAKENGLDEEKWDDTSRPMTEMGETVEEAKDDECLPEQEAIEEVHIHSQKKDVGSGSNSVTTSPSMGSYTDGFLSVADFEDEFEFDTLTMDFNGEKAEYFWKEVEQLEKNRDSEDFDEEDNDILEELRKLEEEQVNRTDVSKSQYLSEQDINEDFDKDDPLIDKEDHETVPDSRDSGKDDSPNSGDPNELETLWEHQELIEQLKMELRKVRATGLPTILEESESPKITEDLKPWKIEEKFQHEECMDELHKFYKSYRERMRKFDIFNYQKMYAMGFVQMKDPLQSISSRKSSSSSSGPALKTLLSQNFWQMKHRMSESDHPMVKLMKELQGDLELVYVGQMCLSWEILHWEYEKALDLWETDPHLIHQYNQVAGELQQFQVLVQRFIEDEAFQGPRVHYYTKNRCVNRYLLQVPVIRVDKKERRRARKGNTSEEEDDDYTITSDILVEMMEVSIRILWRFIRADKDSCCSSGMVKGHKPKPTQLQNPDDLDLLIEVRKVLHKKERKVKEMMRSGNCILKRLRKYSSNKVDDNSSSSEEEEEDKVLYFFSQVDMRLVCRVLNMSKISRDQLLWCQSKLNNISFQHGRIHIEPSFLLFPC